MVTRRFIFRIILCQTENKMQSDNREATESKAIAILKMNYKMRAKISIKYFIMYVYYLLS